MMMKTFPTSASATPTTISPEGNIPNKNAAKQQRVSAGTISPSSATNNNNSKNQHHYQGIINGALFIPSTVPYHFPVGHPLRRLSLLAPDAEIKFKIAFPESFLPESSSSSTTSVPLPAANGSSATNSTTSATVLMKTAINVASTSIFEAVKNFEEGYSSQISKSEHPITPPLSYTSSSTTNDHHTDPVAVPALPPLFGFGTNNNNNNNNNNNQNEKESSLQYWSNELKRLLLNCPNKIESREFISASSKNHHPQFSRARDSEYFNFAVKKLSSVSISSIQHWYLASRFTNDLDLMIKILSFTTIDEALEFLKKQEEISAKNKRKEIDENLTLDELYSTSDIDGVDDDNQNFDDFSNGKNHDLLFGGGGDNNTPIDNNNNNDHHQDNNDNSKTHQIPVIVERDNRWGSPSHRRRVFRFGLWCAFVGSGIIASYHQAVIKATDAAAAEKNNNNDNDDSQENSPTATATTSVSSAPEYVPLHIQLLIETQGHPLYLRSKPVWNNRHEESEGSFSSSWTSWYGEDLSLLRDFDIANLLPGAFCDEKFRLQNSPATRTVQTTSSSSSAAKATKSSTTSSAAAKTETAEKSSAVVIDDQYLATRPLVALPIVFLISTCEKEDYPCTARIAEYLLPPPKLLASKIRSRLIEKHQQQQQRIVSSTSPAAGGGSISPSATSSVIENNNNNNNNNIPTHSFLMTMSDHLPSSLNLLRVLFRSVNDAASEKLLSSTLFGPNSNNSNNTNTALMMKVVATPSFIYSVLIDCYSSPNGGQDALRTLLGTSGKRLVVLGDDSLLTDGGHLEKTGFADVTPINLMELKTEQIAKELQNRRSLVRGGNLLGRILELVRQDFQTKQNETLGGGASDQATSSLASSRQSSITTTSLTPAASPTSASSSSIAINFLAKAAPRITRRRLLHHKEAFSTKLLLRQHAFEFKLQNLSALTRPLEYWWTQQLGFFCGLRPSALAHQLSTFAKSLTDHELEQEEQEEELDSNTNNNNSPRDASNNNHHSNNNSTSNNNNSKGSLSLDMMIGAAASSSKGPVCCAICVSVPFDETTMTVPMDDKDENNSNNSNKTSSSSLHQQQEQEHTRIKKQIAKWESVLKGENFYQSIPSWCYECGVDDIVITTSSSSCKEGNTDMFVENIPPSLANPVSSTADIPLSVAENSSYFSVSQNHHDNYNSTQQSQEFFNLKKYNEDDDGQQQQQQVQPTTTTTASKLNHDNHHHSFSSKKFATFVFYVRFDSFTDHAMDQMNLDAHLFTYHVVKKNSLPLPAHQQQQQQSTSSSSSVLYSSLIQNNVRARTLGNGVRLRVFFGQLSFQRLMDRLRSAKKQENALLCGLMTVPSEKEKDAEKLRYHEQIGANPMSKNDRSSTSSSMASIADGGNTPGSLSSMMPTSTSSSSSNLMMASPPIISRHSTRAGDLPGAKLSKLLSFLYLGSAADAASTSILKEGITHVLNASSTRVFSPSNTLVTQFLGIPDVGDRSVFDIKTVLPLAFAFIDNIQKMHDEAMSALMSGGADVSSSASGSTSNTNHNNSHHQHATSSASSSSTSTVAHKTSPSTGGLSSNSSTVPAFTVTKTTQPSTLGDKNSASNNNTNSLSNNDSSSSSSNKNNNTSNSNNGIIAPKILIHCEKGKSRSVSICVAYLMRLNGWTVGEALHYIRQRRPGVEPNLGFLESLKEYEKEIEKNKALKRRALGVLLRNPAQSLSKAQILRAMQLLGAEEVVDCSDRIAPDGTRRLVTQFASPGGATRAITAAKTLSQRMLALGGRVWLSDFDEMLHALKTGRA